MAEIKEIPGYEGVYCASSDGTIYSLNNGRILTPKKHNSGYRFVRLYKNGKCKGVNIHRIIASLFIPNPDGKPQVNHIDGDKTNNNANNLEWATRSENMRHMFSIGLGDNVREKARQRMKKLGEIYGKQSVETLLEYAMKRAKPVLQIDKNGNVVNRFPSMKNAQAVTGINNINKVLRNKYPTAGGFIWRYA